MPSVLASLRFVWYNTEELPMHRITVGVYQQLAELSSFFLLQLDGLETAVEETLKRYLPDDVYPRGLQSPYSGGLVLHRYML